MALSVAIIHNAKLPVAGYGGTERFVWWLAKGLGELGIEVTLACAPGSQCPFAAIATPDFSQSVESQLSGIDVFHHFAPPAHPPSRPYLVTVGGNGREGETYLPNTVFVSRNHAERHLAECFVHVGVDPEDYAYRDSKQDYLLFLAKAAWRVKNVRGAIRFARRSGSPLRIVGGSRWWLPSFRGVTWEGTLGGPEKAEKIARARGLLFPVTWNEPFGIAVVEALISGTPVLTSAHGSLPELVHPEVGKICRSEREFLEGIDSLGQYRPQRCREWALENFTYQKMARSYRELYERVLKGERLNPRDPRATEPPQKYLPISTF